MGDNLPSRRPSWLSPRVPWKLLLVLAFLILFAIGNFFTALALLQAGSVSAAVFYFFSVFLYLLPAYGLYKLKRWARLLQLVLSLANVLLGAAVMINGNLFTGMINIVIYGLTAIYLLSDECRSLFKQMS